MDVEPATFRDILPGVRGLIPRSLIDGPAWARLLDRTGDLPAWRPGTYFGFEFRLGDPTPAADFFVRMLLGGPFLQEYIRRGEAAEPGSAEASLAGFLLESNRPDSPWPSCSTPRDSNATSPRFRAIAVPPRACS